ncbi:MAG: TIM barrel protein [Lachnospiraceae bacterium]|nr:TIM barrel protein [Lachnospiraceae bacterium]
MKYSLCADIMFVAVGERGPIWPDTDKLIEAMQFAKDNGLTGIEMFGLEERDLDLLAAKNQELGIEIRACVSGGAVWLGDPAKTEALVEAFCASVPKAKQAGCSKLIFNAECYDKTISREEVLAVMEKQLKLIAPVAEKEGVTVLVEPLTGGFFLSSAEAFGLIKAVDSSNVKLLYDIFHFQNIEGKILTTIKENLDLIGDIHGAGAPMRAELTVGELNYEFILNSLIEMGYEGNFCLEFFTFENRAEKVAASCSILPR